MRCLKLHKMPEINHVGPRAGLYPWEISQKEPTPKKEHFLTRYLGYPGGINFLINVSKFNIADKSRAEMLNPYEMLTPYELRDPMRSDATRTNYAIRCDGEVRGVAKSTISVNRSDHIRNRIYNRRWRVTQGSG